VKLHPEGEVQDAGWSIFGLGIAVIIVGGLATKVLERVLNVVFDTMGENFRREAKDVLGLIAEIEDTTSQIDDKQTQMASYFPRPWASERTVIRRDISQLSQARLKKITLLQAKLTTQPQRLPWKFPNLFGFVF